ncbi:MAG: MFS transporter [Syntrophaceae bacterium]|nr:MFS transporter [Syntrophaceae bacterium]
MAEQKPAAQASLVPDWMRPSVKTKIAYAIPYLPLSIIMAVMMIELQIYYTDTLLVPAGLLALIIAISRAWDAINDPAMGWISDHTRTRWGRRIPYIVLGIPLTAVCFWLLFVPPEGFTPLQVCLWGGIIFFFFYLFNTIWAIPYNALGFELTPDYNDRTSLFGYRVFVSAFGFIFAFGLLFYLKYADIFEGDERKMLSLVTGVGALLMVIFFAVPVLTIKENPIFLQFKRSPIVPGIRRALRNGPFRLLFWVMILGTIPITLPILIMPYFVKYVVAAPSQYRLLYALVYVISGFVAIPVWMYIGKRWGKVHVWMIAVAMGIIASLAMFFVGKGELYLMGGLELFRGFGSTASQVLIPAMIADIIDYDEFNTGKRREAQFGAFLGLLPKFVVIISGALPLAVLGIVGYDPAAGGINDNTHFAIRILYAILPFAFHGVCLVLLFFYPLSAEVHASIREGVELHKKGQIAKDPLTGQMKMPIDAQAVPEDTGWFLDYFSPRELKNVVAKGVGGLVGKVYMSVLASAAVVVACGIGIFYILIGAMTASQADQARQAVASGLVFCCGLAIAVTIYHCLRIGTAKKMTANPIDKAMIQTHIDQI